MPAPSTGHGCPYPQTDKTFGISLPFVGTVPEPGALASAEGYSVEECIDPERVCSALAKILHLHEEIRELRVQIELKKCPLPDDRLMAAQRDGLDQQKLIDMTRLAMRPGSTLGGLVQLLRGETSKDSRPNKALRPLDYRKLLKGYQHVDFMVDAAWHGLQPRWKDSDEAADGQTKNHQSARRYLKALTRSVRAGQNGGQYLVLDDRLMKVWNKVVHVSPLAAIDKAGKDPEDEVRLIHDLSYPHGYSTNDRTDRSVLPELVYRPVAELAQRIEALHVEDPSRNVMMMKGDVKGAFRHLMVTHSSVGWMAAILPSARALIVDLSAPFGWTSSPTYYGAFGGAITWLVAHESPATMSPAELDPTPFFSYEWVDDHVLIEREVGHRPELANAALRLSMLAVFGPRVINEDKFTAWSTKLEVLGLSFDTERRTVTMPQRKIDKAILRVEAMGGQSKTTRIALRQLLGSLRHVCTCCRAMKPFFQRVQSLAIIAPPHGTIAMGSDVLQDLKWTASILRAGRFKDLPTAMFGAWPDPDVHLYMDASNAGLAVLDPAQRRFVRVKFDEAECDQIENPPEQHGLTINVREQLSVAIAALVWGKEWKQQHTITQVWCWVDNTTAVACANKLSSRNHLAQELNRAIGWSEAVNGFRIRCLHLPGRINRMADAASRAWSQPHTDVWNAMSQGWRSQEVPAELRKPYVPRSENYSAQVWPQAPGSSTTVVGSNGCSGRISKDGADGCQPTNLSTLIDSCYSRPTVGPSNHADWETRTPPFCPSSAIYHGVIAWTEDMPSVCTKDITWPCKGCAGCPRDPQHERRQLYRSSEPFGAVATYPAPTNAYCGGLRSWAISSCCEAQSIFTQKAESQTTSSRTTM
jgi:hypothetical protein